MNKSVQLDVLGMTCAACSRTVERSLNKTAGVAEAAVNIATEKASVTYDPALLGGAALVAAVREVGYDVRTVEQALPIGGMTCAACVRHVERALSKVDGVRRGQRQPGHRARHGRVPAARWSRWTISSRRCADGRL